MKQIKTNYTFKAQTPSFQLQGGRVKKGNCLRRCEIFPSKPLQNKVEQEPGRVALGVKMYF